MDDKRHHDRSLSPHSYNTVSSLSMDAPAKRHSSLNITPSAMEGLKEGDNLNQYPLNHGVPFHEILNKDTKRKRCCCCFRTKKMCLLAFFILLALLGAAGFFLFPRIPNIQIQQINLPTPGSSGLNISSINEVQMSLNYTIFISVDSSNYIPWIISPLLVNGYYPSPSYVTNSLAYIGKGEIPYLTISPLSTTEFTIPFYFSYNTTFDVGKVPLDPVLSNVINQCTSPKYQNGIKLLFKIIVSIPVISWFGVKPTIDVSRKMGCPFLPSDVDHLSNLILLGHD